MLLHCRKAEEIQRAIWLLGLLWMRSSGFAEGEQVQTAEDV